MKKALSLLVLIAFINACDDGNLTQEDISFADVTATQSCSNSSINTLIYKLKDQEALIMEIPTTTFKSEPTPDGQPIELNIGANSNRVVYRFYNGTVATANICETITPATPVITDQWTATDGVIQIVTTAKIAPRDAANNSTKITGYNHNIILKNITFAKTNGTQVYETFPFGNYVTPATNLPFNFDQTLEKCTTSNEVYNYNTSEALILNIDPNLILNEVTPLNSPRTGLIGTTTNSFTYRLFTGGGLLTGDYFCQSPVPTTPVLNQEWNGEAGVAGQTGIIEVTTTTSGASFIHTIVLKKVSLKKGNSSFSLGDNYTLGELFTTP